MRFCRDFSRGFRSSSTCIWSCTAFCLKHTDSGILSPLHLGHRTADSLMLPSVHSHKHLRLSLSRVLTLLGRPDKLQTFAKDQPIRVLKHISWTPQLHTWTPTEISPGSQESLLRKKQLVKKLCAIKGQKNKQNPLLFENFSDKDD